MYQLDSEILRSWFVLVESNKTKLTKDYIDCITSFSFEDNESEADECSISFNGLTIEMINKFPLVQNSEIKIKWGYTGGKTSEKRIMVIKEIKPSFADGISLELTAHDKSIEMTQEKQRVWEKSTPGYRYSDIAIEMAKEMGLKYEVEPTQGYNLRLHQGNKSDINYLKELAEKSKSVSGKINYKVFVQDDTLHFHPSNIDKVPKNDFIFRYFDDNSNMVLSFVPTNNENKSEQGGQETRSKSIDIHKKQVNTNIANNKTNNTRPILGKQVSQPKVYYRGSNTNEFNQIENNKQNKIIGNPAKHMITSSNNNDDNIVKTNNKFIKKELLKVEASLQILGIPELISKQNIEVQNVGPYSGVYYCKSVKHTLNSSGYICDVSLNKNALGKKNKNTTKANGKEVKAKGNINNSKDKKIAKQKVYYLGSSKSKNPITGAEL